MKSYLRFLFLRICELIEDIKKDRNYRYEILAGLHLYIILPIQFLFTTCLLTLTFAFIALFYWVQILISLGSIALLAIVIIFLKKNYTMKDFALDIWFTIKYSIIVYLVYLIYYFLIIS